MLDFQEEEKLRRLLQAIPDPEPEHQESTERNRDELGRFTPEETESPSKSENVTWVQVNDGTYVRREWPLWTDVLFILGVVGFVALVL